MLCFGWCMNEVICCIVRIQSHTSDRSEHLFHPSTFVEADAGVNYIPDRVRICAIYCRLIWQSGKCMTRLCAHTFSEWDSNTTAV